MNPIMAIKINGRLNRAPHVQEILTQYGCNIETRVGFHEASQDQCSMDGFIVLQLCGEKDEIQAMHRDLDKVDGVSAKLIDF